MTELVRVDVDGSLAYLTLSNPPVNALSRGVLEAVGEAARALDDDPEVTAIVVRGAGRAFAAGGDIAELVAVDPADAARYAAAVQDAVAALAGCGKVVIAQVHGFALGGGTEIALAADFRIAADDATFGLPEVLLGLIPGTGGTHRLRRVVGRTRAKELILSGRTVPAAEAERIGLVDAIVPKEELESAVREFADRFAHSSPAAIRAAKALVDADALDPLAAESEAFAALLGGRDAQIGLSSFLDTGALGRADFRAGDPHEAVASTGKRSGGEGGADGRA